MKKISSILAVASCCMLGLFTLSGCDALGIRVTEHGIQAPTNVLLIGTIILIVLVVVVQRLTQR